MAENYLNKLKINYNYLAKSRVVNRRETDPEALAYFQNFCNESIPKTESENMVRDLARDLFYADKTSFIRCCRSSNSHYILLTDNRTIVMHFGIQDLIFIKWDGNKYIVQKNDIQLTPKKFRNNK